MFMVTISPAAVNFGYDFVLLVHFLGHPVCLDFYSFHDKSEKYEKHSSREIYQARPLMRCQTAIFYSKSRNLSPFLKKLYAQFYCERLEYVSDIQAALVAVAGQDKKEYVIQVSPVLLKYFG